MPFTELPGIKWEKRAQSSTVGAEGGYLVPRQQAVRFWLEVLDDELLSQINTVILASDSQPAFIRGNTTNLATWVAEGAAIPSVDDTFQSGGPAQLHKLVAASTASVEFMQDIMTYLSPNFSEEGGESMGQAVLNALQAKRISKTLHSAVLNGSGVNQPLGLLQDTDITTISAALSDTTIRQVYTTLASSYAKDAVWVVSPGYWPTLRSTTSDLSTEGSQAYILDRPVILSEYMPTTGTVLLFGDLSHFVMTLSPTIRVVVDTQSDALTGKIRTYSYQRADGRYVRGTEGMSVAILNIP